MLIPEVLKAFETLGLDPDTPIEIARSTYKKLALTHHPDRNHGDSTATQRFQKIGAAWQICQKHYDHPSWSHASDTKSSGRRGTYDGPSYGCEDEIPMDDYEAEMFFRFMFEEMLFARFTYAKAQRYRRERSGAAGGGVFTFSGGFAESQNRQEENRKKQQEENEAYQKRVRELDLEIAAQNRERERLAKEKAKAEDRIVTAQHRAFTFGRLGDSEAMRSTIEQYDLDVKAPERINQKVKKENPRFETMLHIAAASCKDVELLAFIIRRGALTSALDHRSLTPFQTAVLWGNAFNVRWFLEWQQVKPVEGCHPSKSASDGRSPLQLAIASGVPEVVQLLVKNATVHDVTKCYIDGEKSIWPKKASDGIVFKEENWPQIKDALLSKKGFTPFNNGLMSYSEEQQCHKPSQKSAKKRSQEQEAALKAEEKARRIAEQNERAAQNLRKKQERAERLAEEARKREQEEAARHAAQEAEQMRRKAEEEETRRREAERQAEIARQVAERKAAEAARRDAERLAEVARQEAEAEEKRQKEAAENKRKLKEAGLARRLEREARLRAERDVRVKAERDTANKTEQERIATLRAAEEEEMRKCEEAAEARRAEENRRVEQEQRLEAEREIMEQAAREEQHVQRQAKHEAEMRKRAEQSAKDRARSQRLREERQRRKDIPEPTNSLPTPPTTSQRQLSSHLNFVDRDQNTETATSRRHPRSLRHASDRHQVVTSDSLVSAPIYHSRPLTPQHVQNVNIPGPRVTPLSPPASPEDFQTRETADELFRHEMPPALLRARGFRPEPTTSTQLFTNNPMEWQATGTGSEGPSRGTGRGRGRGRGRGMSRGRGQIRGRWRGRGQSSLYASLYCENAIEEGEGRYL